MNEQEKRWFFIKCCRHWMLCTENDLPFIYECSGSPPFKKHKTAEQLIKDWDDGWPDGSTLPCTLPEYANEMGESPNKEQ